MLNKESYNRSIARCRYTFRLPKLIAFTLDEHPIFTASIFLAKPREAYRITNSSSDFSFDFRDTKTVLVREMLYAFDNHKDNPVSAFKVTNFTSPDYLMKTTLSTLPHCRTLSKFAVSYVAGKIVLTGGVGAGFA